MIAPYPLRLTTYDLRLTTLFLLLLLLFNGISLSGQVEPQDTLINRPETNPMDTLELPGEELINRDSLRDDTLFAVENTTGDSTGTGDTLKAKNPNVAYKRSMILPGLGQIYNGSYWKVPVIYAGLGAFSYFFIFNNKNYILMKKAYNFKEDHPDSLGGPFPGRDISSVKAERDYYRRNRDMIVIFAALWYTLNIVDAYVEAHLKGFNVSDDLSLQIRPSVIHGSFAGIGYGAALSIRIL